jgi:nitronate monooxygenase
MMNEPEPHAACIPQYPLQNWLTTVMKKGAREQNQAEPMSLWFGQAASLIRHRRAAKLVDALIAETDKLLG